MPKKISRDKTEAVKSGIRSGRTTVDIPRTTGASKWTINRIRKEEKNMKTHDRGGRPLVVSKITSAIIRLKFRQGLLGTASDAQLFSRSLGYNISKRSVRRLLRKLGFKSGIKKHKPFISYANQKKRIKWCRDKAS
jgi:transposase